MLKASGAELDRKIANLNLWAKENNVTVEEWNIIKYEFESQFEGCLLKDECKKRKISVESNKAELPN